MQIIIDKQTNIVKYLGKVLSEEGVFWPHKRDLTTNKSNSFSAEVDSAPSDFVGGHYTWTEAGGFVATPLRAKSLANAQELAEKERETRRVELKNRCRQAVANLIQSEVDKYNSENDIPLKDVYRCQQYAQASNYTHQAFCQAVWGWNVEVWEAASVIFGQTTGKSAMTSNVQDFMDLLPKFTYSYSKE